MLAIAWIDVIALLLLACIFQFDPKHQTVNRMKFDDMHTHTHTLQTLAFVVTCELKHTLRHHVNDEERKTNSLNLVGDTFAIFFSLSLFLLKVEKLL